jgi:hypothetical protein
MQRFTLSWMGLCLATACLATAAGCGDDKLPIPESQQGVAEDIKSRGGLVGVSVDNPEFGVTAVDLQGTNADDALVARLSAFPELNRLVLRKTQITDAAVRHLLEFRKLTYLDVGDSKLTDKGRAVLRDQFPDIELYGAEEPIEDTTVENITE